MKKSKASQAHYNRRYEMTISKAELREMVKAEVQKAMTQSQVNDTHYECAIGKLEMSLDTDSSLDAPQLKIPLLPAAATSRSDSAEDSERPASHTNKHSTSGKVNGKLLQAMEATKNTMRMMKVEYEDLKVVHDDLEEATSMKAITEGCLFHETPVVPIQKESDGTEIPVEVKEEDPLEQTIAVKTKVEPMDEELTSPKHLEQEAFTCPPLPAMPFPAVLNMEAVSYSIPPRMSLQLALIRNPPGLSLLWNVEEEDPSTPPMESYSVYAAMEVVKGSGVFQEWRALGVVKAIPLPMCVMITRLKPACFAVVGKDVFRRYGPYSKVMLAEVPEQTATPS